MSLLGSALHFMFMHVLSFNVGLYVCVLFLSAIHSSSEYHIERLVRDHQIPSIS